MKLSVSLDNNNYVIYNQETIKSINQTASNNVTPNIFVRIWNSLTSWLSNLF